MRSIGLVTTSRADWGIYLPVARAIRDSTHLQLRLYVSGAHLSAVFGYTAQQIEKDGFAIDERIESMETGVSATTPEALSRAFARAVAGFAALYGRAKPDILLLLGDRYEMLAAAVAALPYAIPIAHIHGGELTSGVIDEAVRHALTKMSHLHFVATEAYRTRVLQMGEEAWRICVSGAPALDQLGSFSCMERAELEALCGLPLNPAPLLVTFHPDTLSPESAELQISQLLAALHAFDAPCIFTLPGADAGAQQLIAAIEVYVRSHPQTRCVSALGTRGYWSLMRVARAMVGNSSSGIIEAPSFELPVLNIGDRQAGRVRAANVIDVGTGEAQILSGLQRLVKAEFKQSLYGLTNPYQQGLAAPKIVQALESCRLGRELLLKRFQDL